MLREQVRIALESYFEEFKDEEPCNVYQLVLGEIEKPMLEVIMKHMDNNQSRASRVLGINRNTLRKKLEQYDLI